MQKLTDPLSTVAFQSLEELIKQASHFREDPSNDSVLRSYMGHVERSCKDVHKTLSEYALTNPKMKNVRVNVVPQRTIIPSNEQQWDIDVFFGCLQKLGYGYESSRDEASQMSGIVQNGWQCNREIVAQSTSCLYALANLEVYLQSNSQIFSAGSLKICYEITSNVLGFLSTTLPHLENTLGEQHWSGNVTPLSPADRDCTPPIRSSRDWTPPHDDPHNMEVTESGGAFSKPGLKCDDDDDDVGDSDESDSDTIGADVEMMEDVVPSSQSCKKRTLKHGPFSSLWASMINMVTRWFFDVNSTVDGVLTTVTYKTDEKVNYVQNPQLLAHQLRDVFESFRSTYNSGLPDKVIAQRFRTFITQQKTLLRKLVIPSSEEKNSNFGAYMSFLSNLDEKDVYVTDGCVVYGARTIPLKCFLNLCESIDKLPDTDDDGTAVQVETAVEPKSKKARFECVDKVESHNLPNSDKPTVGPVAPGPSRLKSMFAKHDKKKDDKKKDDKKKDHHRKKSVTTFDGASMRSGPTAYTPLKNGPGIIPTDYPTDKAVDLAKRYNVTYA